MRRCDDAEGVQKFWRPEDTKMLWGFKKSLDPKMRRSEDAKMRRGFKEIWDPKMRRCDDAEGFLEFWRPQNTKMRRCQDATMRDWLFYHPALLYWCIMDTSIMDICIKSNHLKSKYFKTQLFVRNCSQCFYVRTHFIGVGGCWVEKYMFLFTKRKGTCQPFKAS